MSDVLSKILARKRKRFRRGLKRCPSYPKALRRSPIAPGFYNALATARRDGQAAREIKKASRARA